MTDLPPRRFVAVSGIHPVAVADSLEDAQAWALRAQTRFVTVDQYEYRWKAEVPGEIWQLQERRRRPGARFASVDRSVHAVEHVPA
jgi:hypothetical protein